MNMPPTNSTSQSVAVIGGGIAGLAAAHRLIELNPALQVTLFEAGPRLGGVLSTEPRDGFLLEHSADNFITTSPWAVALCQRIGFAEELIQTNEAQRRALVVCRGRLEHVPDGFVLLAPRKLGPLVRTPILSLAGKLRLLAEYFVPARRDESDESLASFARRRLGREAYERLVQPLVGGIYTADAEKLSIQATLLRFVDMERQHGGLIRALREQAKASANEENAAGARYSMFVAPRAGLTSLVEALAARLPTGTVRLNSPVERLERASDGQWIVRQVGGESELFDAVIVAAPAPQAANLLERVDGELSGDLARIPYAGCAIALVGYRRDQIDHALDGFGFVVPEIENRRILACSFSSNKFPGRAPDDHVLLRVFVGGARHPELLALDDADLRGLVCEELHDLLHTHGEPTLFEVRRWNSAMPQYHLGHRDLVARIESRVMAIPGLALAGNAYRGVGIPDCIHSGEIAAERIVGGAPR